MTPILAFLKDTLRLSAVPFVVFVFGAGTLLLFHRRTIAWGRRWLTAAVLGYWLLATPSGAWLVSAPASRKYRPIVTRDQAQGAQAVVMLGGGILSRVADGMGLDDLGTSALRAIETARVYKLLGDPLVIVSGGNTQRMDPPRPEAEAYRAAVVSLGVPAPRVVVEDRALTTHEEALLLKPMLEARGITRFVLVTTPTHMGRSLATFRAAGLDPIPSACHEWGTDDASPWTIMPTRSALTLSDTALYDYMATIYYWMRGWL